MRYGATDLGQVGMEQFFKSHCCRRYCKELGLEDRAKKEKTKRMEESA